MMVSRLAALTCAVCVLFVQQGRAIDCPKGQEPVGVDPNETCQPCFGDFYSNDEGSEKCKPCPGTPSSDGTGSTSSLDRQTCACAAGRELSPVLAGSVDQRPPYDANAKCQKCRKGFSEAGKQCGNCPRQSESTNGITCACIPGTAPSSGACEQCQGNRISPGGNTPCSLCPVGSSTTDRINCECDAGTQLSTDKLSCVKCGANQISKKGGTCTPCQDDSTTADNKTCVCKANFEVVTTDGKPDQCKACPTDPLSVSEAGKPCVPCPSGSSVVQGKCVCPAGQELKANACQDCPQGQTSVAGGSCSVCPPFSTLSGGRCVCEAGRELDGGTCQRCFLDTISVAGGSCKKCPDNSTSTNGLKCDCDAGLEFKAGTPEDSSVKPAIPAVPDTCIRCRPQEFSVKGGACGECPANSTFLNNTTCECAAGSQLSTDKLLCVKCVGNQISVKGGTCTPCQDNSTTADNKICVCAAGTGLVSGQCQNCAPGISQPGGTCGPCQTGFTSTDGKTCGAVVVTPVCPTTTRKLSWAEGTDLDSQAGTASDAACFKLCANRTATPLCTLSIRDPVSGDCFLKAKGPADLRRSLNLSSTYCTRDEPVRPPVCATTTRELTWAEGTDLDSQAGTADDAACFKLCADRTATPLCTLSIRDPSNGNCFLKAARPDQLQRSLTLSSTYCTAAGTQVCPTTTRKLSWAEGTDLDSQANTADDAACFELCAKRTATPRCTLSIREPSNGNCFLKAKGPADLRASLTLSSTYCT